MTQSRVKDVKSTGGNTNYLNEGGGSRSCRKARNGTGAGSWRKRKVMKRLMMKTVQRRKEKVRDQIGLRNRGDMAGMLNEKGGGPGIR